jgi:hypothetical protein
VSPPIYGGSITLQLLDFSVSSAAANSNLSSNASDFANIVSYHIVSGNFTNESPSYPNITIGRTLLNDSSLVQLEDKESQVLAWSKDVHGIFVLNNG